MAIVHFAMKSRTNIGPQCAQRAVHYLLREREYAPRPGREAGMDVLPTARERTDFVWSETHALPSWAGGDAATFFEAALTYERVNGRWGIGLEIALPRELTRDQQRALVHDFVASQLPQKPCLVVLHEPHGMDGAQPHVHILLSTRTHDGLDRTPDTYFHRANSDHPALGGALKDPQWSLRQWPMQLRTAYTDLANAALERAGHAVRLDPRSLAARGIVREAEGKAGWRRDGVTQRLNVRAQRELTRAEEQAQAMAFWEARKVALGLAGRKALEGGVVVDRTRAWSQACTPGRQLPSLDAQKVLAQIEAEYASIARTEARLHVEVLKAERDVARGFPPSWAAAERTTSVMTQAGREIEAVRLGVLGQLVPEVELAHRKIRVPLLEREAQQVGRDL